MQDLAALRRPEGPRLQFEGFVPVVVTPSLPAREEIRGAAAKLQRGDLSESELSQLSRHVAAATFPSDPRGQELCRKLIAGLNTLNRIFTEDSKKDIDPLLLRDLPLTRQEQREYAKLFAEMEFPTATNRDELGRVLWRGYITGSLPPNEEALLHSLIEKTGRSLVWNYSGLTSLQSIGDTERLFSL